MNAKLLLQHFERISEAPDAIPRLRRFILDLAVRGKLVEQDPNDEPAAELLKRIQAEKAGLVKEGRLRPEKQLPKLDANLTDFNAPLNWEWVKLGQIIKLWNGYAFKSGDFQTIGIPVIRIGDLQNGQVNTDSAAHVPTTVADKVAPEIWIPPDALLIAMSGATTGKVAFNRSGLRLLLNQRVGRIEVFNLNISFLKFFFETIIVRNLSISFGTAIPNLSAQQINETAFPLPPLAEQHRIVTKVDELMALCDQLEAAKTEREQSRDRLLAANLHNLNQPTDDEEAFREHARFTFNHLKRITARPAHIKQLRQTILNLAVRGKLVPQDPNDEPAAKLLKKIIEEKKLVTRGEKTKRESHLFENRNFSKSFHIPECWHWTTLGEIAFEFRYGTSVKCSYTPTGEPVLRIPNIDNGRINIDNLKFGPLPTREAENLRLRLGDILIVRSNGSLDLVGRPALVDTHAIDYCYAGYLVRVRTSTIHLYAPYLLLALNTTHVRDQIEIPIRTTVGLKNVNTTELGGLTIPLPPLAEQNRIVAKVDELMVLCDQLEAQLTSTEIDSRRLLEAVLHEALAPTLGEAA